MKWTIKIGTLFGIGLNLHLTFILLLGILGSFTWLSTGQLWMVLTGGLLVAAVFICVLFHELGHALVGGIFGIKTREITLLPIGGIARMENNPEKPAQEVWITLAGPAANLVIASCLMVGLLAMKRFGSGQTITLFSDSFLSRLILINLFLAAFNLLPAFPMDGGRVLRALLTKRLGRRRGAVCAAKMGLGIATLVAVMGIFYNPWLLLIALIIFLGARAEATFVEMKFALKGLRVSDAMITRYRTLSTHDRLDVAAGELLASDQRDFPIVDSGQVVGLLSRKRLIKLLEIRPVSTQISQVLPHQFLAVEGTDSLLAAVEKMRQYRVESVPIVMENLIIGLLTTGHVNELIRVNSALMHRRASTSSSYLPPLSSGNEGFQELPLKS